MKLSIRKGFSFGLTSGIITVLGLMVGLDSGTHEKAIVLGGVLVIAFADALSDAFGMHMAEESTGLRTQREIWEATFATLFSKLFFALTFVVPILLLNLDVAVIVNIIWGIILIWVFSYIMAFGQEGQSPHKVVLEHVLLSIIVIAVTYYIGTLFGSF